MINKKVFYVVVFLLLFFVHGVSGGKTNLSKAIDFSEIESPIVLRGDSKRALRQTQRINAAGLLVI